ncbi:MAG: hypothetical protein FD181_3143 [Prolixibacteraceae bacterium]|nr:MAG: hypothetical protein FD181_3143 [Prolixibacteraceae bacterium]
MKTQDLDNELKSLIKGVKLDSPGSGFTSKVMSRVFEEKTVMEKVKDEKMLATSFWVILLLFVFLIVSMFIFSGRGIQEEGQLSKMLNSLNNGSLSSGYQSVFSKLAALPLSIGGILLATSVLVFIDRFLSQFMSNFSAHKI